jgi:hypothetical protein
MDAPKCIVCNTRHWSTQPCPAMADVIAEERKQQARRALNSVTKNLSGVTENTPEPVTKNVHSVTTNTPTTVTENPVSENQTPISVTLGSTRPRGRPRSDNPLSQAERARRYRAKVRATIPSSQ